MFIAYIYNQNNEVIAQVEKILDINIETKLNNISTASFGLYQTNPYCTREFLKEYRRIVINEQIGSIETTMFDGIIRGFDADLEKTNIKLESFEHLLYRRLLHQNYSFTDQSVNSIIQTILSDINTRYNTNIILDCGITQTTSKEYKKADNFLKVLQDLAGNGFEFIISNLVLIFKETIGIDRTGIGEDFVEYRYDINEPGDRSIDSVKMTVDGKELANGVIGKAGANYTELSDNTSIDEFGLIESSFTNSGDQANATQSFLDDHKNSLSEFEIGTITNNFFEADLGDLVSVYLYVGNDILFYDGVMKVIQKQYIGGDLPNIQFTLGKTKVQSKNIIGQIADVQTRLKTLELQ